MVSDISLRMPGNLDLPHQYFGLLSGRDLIRLGGPTAVGVLASFPPTTLTDVLPVCVGLLVGTLLAVVRIQERPVDVHLRYILTWLLARHRLGDPPLRIRNYRSVLTGDGTAIAVIEVTPTDIAMQTRSEHRSLHGLYQTVLETVNYPIELHSRQRPRSLDAYIEDVTTAPQADADTPMQHQLRAAYAAYCDYLNDDQLIATQHYIIVRATPEHTAQLATLAQTIRHHLLNHLHQVLPPALAAHCPEPHPGNETPSPSHSPVEEVDRRAAEVATAVTRSDLTATRVTGTALIDCVEHWRCGTPAATADWVQTPTPATADPADTDQTGGEFRRTLVITEFPSTTTFAWPHSLLEVDGLVDITQVVVPRDPAATTASLRRTVNRLDAEIASQQVAGYGGTNQYEARRADADWMLDALADRDDTPVDYACYVTVHAEDAATCRQTLAQIRTRLQTLQFTVTDTRYRTAAAYHSQSPFAGDGLQETQLMPASAAAAGFPFTTVDAIAPTGIIYGETQGDRTPILLDRWRWSSHSLARMGMVGSGKSYATKLDLLRTWLTTDDIPIYVVDPKQEYQPLIETLGGTTHTLTETAVTASDLPTSGVHGFTVPDRGEPANIPRLCQLVQALYTRTSQSTQPTLVVIDEGRILLNTDDGRHTLNQFVLEARDTNTAITIVTQNASHFTQSREGRELLDNMPATQLFRHDRIPHSMQQYFRLSEHEVQTLYALQTGTDSLTSEAVLRVADRVETHITVRATAVEHRLIQGAGSASAAPSTGGDGS